MLIRVNMIRQTVNYKKRPDYKSQWSMKLRYRITLLYWYRYRRFHYKSKLKKIRYQNNGINLSGIGTRIGIHPNRHRHLWESSQLTWVRWVLGAWHYRCGGPRGPVGARRRPVGARGAAAVVEGRGSATAAAGAGPSPARTHTHWWHTWSKIEFSINTEKPRLMHKTV